MTVWWDETTTPEQMRAAREALVARDETAKIELDPRWEWVEAPRALCSSSTSYVKGRCLHTDVVPVEAGGETVAHLCLTCDSQLPGEWQA